MGLSSLENILAITVWVSRVLTPSPYIFKFIFLPTKEDCLLQTEDPAINDGGCVYNVVKETQFSDSNVHCSVSVYQWVQIIVI